MRIMFLACSCLHFGYCLVLRNVKQLFFAKFMSACMHARPFNYLDALVLHRAHVPCTHACIMYAQCDVTRVHI